MLQEHSLWQFSLKVYEHPELQALLLEAQDTAGADVNFVLAACWLADSGRAFTYDQAKALWHSTEELREQGIAPVRALRRRWKNLAGLQEPRKTLKALELSLEKHLQDLLYQALAVDGAVIESDHESKHANTEALLESNLTALIVSEQAIWHALVPRFVAQYSAVAGQN